MKKDSVAVLEAAYELGGPDSGWLRNLARTARPVLPVDQGVIACVYNATDPAWITLEAVTALEIDVGLVQRLHAVPVERGNESAAMVQLVRSGAVTTLSRGIGNIPVCRRHYAPILRAEGLKDILYVNAANPSHIGCLLIVPSKSGQWAPRAAHNWKQIAAHIAAGVRLRRKLGHTPTDSLTPKAGAVEAILTPAGGIAHALPSAQSARSRERLREAAVGRERARSRLRSYDPEQALSAWQALVDGRWSLLDHFDSDGRRYVIARRNEAALDGASVLSERERQVLSYASLGHANKLIAYELGISTATVVHLMNARAKLRAIGVAGAASDATARPIAK